MLHSNKSIIRSITATALMLSLLASCGKEDADLDREILLSTLWLESRHTSPNTTEQYIHNFTPEGILLVEKRVTSDKEEHRYIYEPENDKLAVEDFGLFKVESISVSELRLRDDGNKTTILTRYGNIENKEN